MPRCRFDLGNFRFGRKSSSLNSSLRCKSSKRSNRFGSSWKQFGVGNNPNNLDPSTRHRPILMCETLSIMHFLFVGLSILSS